MRVCDPRRETVVHHVVNLHPCCPVSGNPKEGSQLQVSYRPKAGVVFPVEDLAEMAHGYVGGRYQIRNMEEMIQDIADRISEIVRSDVRAVARLIISPPYGGDDQHMRVTHVSRAAQ